MAVSPEATRTRFDSERTKAVKGVKYILRRIEERVDDLLEDGRTEPTAQPDPTDPRHGVLSVEVRARESLAVDMDSRPEKERHTIETELQRGYLDAGWKALSIDWDDGTIHLDCTFGQRPVADLLERWERYLEELEGNAGD